MFQLAQQEGTTLLSPLLFNFYFFFGKGRGEKRMRNRNKRKNRIQSKKRVSLWEPMPPPWPLELVHLWPNDLGITLEQSLLVPTSFNRGLGYGLTCFMLLGGLRGLTRGGAITGTAQFCYNPEFQRVYSYTSTPK